MRLAFSYCCPVQFFRWQIASEGEIHAIVGFCRLISNALNRGDFIWVLNSFIELNSYYYRHHELSVRIPVEF